ncbi:hypothetical protein DID74_00490 [Candidatus Marinamargulisbacteria bacterium SCGC AG-333-B06]|nr:hypothetical protein DID74_00490 [Candidatus Marinamargulisbacteria bacterium SCGC AG-333-B06]
MKNIFIISQESCNLCHLKETLPHTRWIHHKHSEEGIASISLYGHQLHAVFISENVSFLDTLQIQKLIKTQFPSLPIMLIRSFTDIIDCIQGNYTHRCLASYDDFQSIQILLRPPVCLT